MSWKPLLRPPERHVGCRGRAGGCREAEPWGPERVPGAGAGWWASRYRLASPAKSEAGRAVGCGLSSAWLVCHQEFVGQRPPPRPRGIIEGAPELPTLQSVVASGALAAWTVPDHVGTWARPSSSQTGCSVMGSGPPLPQLVCFSCMVVWGLDAGSPLCPVAPHQGERGLLTSRSQPLRGLPGERDPTHEPCRQAQTLCHPARPLLRAASPVSGGNQ